MNLYWLQSGGCSGDSMSLLNMESPDLAELCLSLGLNILWHPSLSNGSSAQHQQLIDDMINGDTSLDILCVEGNVVRGPDNTGMFDTFLGRPKKDIIEKLAHKAKYVIAIGTCASWGGIGCGDEMDGIGLQYLRFDEGGFLGSEFRSASGLPVINLSGCPVHYSVVAGTLTLLAGRIDIEMTSNNQPSEWFNITVHQGCTRNEYHEYKIEEEAFGALGCMFFHMGCKGPTTYAACNKLLWNRRSSKTRVGVPCMGCTRQDFPQPEPFFKTPNIGGTPLEMPIGVDRVHYLAYRSLANAAAPDRLKKRKTKV